MDHETDLRHCRPTPDAHHDPAFLLLTNGVLSLALTVVLLVSRIGMAEGARGLHTWVVGDVLLAASRALVGLGLLASQASGLVGLAGSLGSGAMLPMRQLRLVAHQRQKLVGMCSAEKNRLHKVLVDAK